MSYASCMVTQSMRLLPVYHVHILRIQVGVLQGTADVQHLPCRSYLDIVHAQLDFKLMPQKLQQASYASQVPNLRPRHS